MPLFSDLHRITALDGLFHGTPDTQIIVLLQHLRTHNHMRFAADGRPESATLSALFETRFRENFDLTSEQYHCIVDVFDRNPIEDIPAAIGASFNRPGTHPQQQYRRRTFKSERVQCCGRALRVRWVSATVFLKDDCYAAWNIMKSCRHGCGTTYCFDRRIIVGEYDDGPCRWHLYNAWSDGELPPFISSKSGHSIFSTSFLDYVAIEQATTR